MGNLGIRETGFQHIFSLAQTSGKNVGLTASTVFSNLVQNYLSLSIGEATIDTYYKPADADGNHAPSANYADVRRAQVIDEAVRGRYVTYDFFLAHLSDIDEQGHVNGVDKKYNVNDTYNYAITQKVGVLREMMENLPNDTILLITSDHGHVGTC